MGFVGLQFKGLGWVSVGAVEDAGGADVEEDDMVAGAENDVSDFFSLFRSMADKLNKHELERWAVVVWAIWGARNKFYFEKGQLQPEGIVEGATGMLTKFQSLIATQTTP
ncbi:hypothetical protein CMV_018360 [Castanea mollissima]|uniref:Uncharacterized protein n=1 Tax=Castanea mollissima TaxID=60419 RepID=A0A8J4VNV2_9ROSI|nr:hypothetical protein CMV_018360 [Castanea mollissima]